MKQSGLYFLSVRVKLCNSRYRWPPSPQCLHFGACRTASGKWEDGGGRERGSSRAGGWEVHGGSQERRRGETVEQRKLKLRRNFFSNRGGAVQEVQTGWRGGGLEEKRVWEAEKWWKRNEWDVLVHKQKLWENNVERTGLERWLSDSHSDVF